MMSINLLDLNNDLLNIIGACVKNDNIDRMEKEGEEAFEHVNKLMRES